MTPNRWLLVMHALQWIAIVVLFVRLNRAESLMQGLFTRWGGRKGGG